MPQIDAAEFAAGACDRKDLVAQAWNTLILRQRCAQAALNWVRTTWDGSANAALIGLLVARHPTPSDATAIRRNKSLFLAANSRFGRARALAHATHESLDDKLLQAEKNDRDLGELRSALTDSRARLVLCEDLSK